MDTFWTIADGTMVIMLFRYRASWPLCAIQLFQFLEIPFLWAHPGFHWWRDLDVANVALEILSIRFAGEFSVAQWAMAAHVALKCLQYLDVDCDWQFHWHPLGPIRYFVNNAIIVILIWYCALRRNYAIRFQEETPEPSTRASRSPEATS